MNKAQMVKQEKQYQAEHDLRALIEAEKIKNDKARYAAAMKAHKEQLQALKEVAADKEMGT